jgi:aminomethyltransferase
MAEPGTTGFHIADEPAVLILRGEDAGEFLNGQVTNDVSALADGESRYALLLTPKGKLRADMRIARDGDETLVVARAEQLPVIRKTIDTFRIGFFFSTEDATGEWSLIEIAGPQAAQALAATTIPHVPLDSPLGADALVARGDTTALAEQLAAAGLDQVDRPAIEAARVAAGVPAFGGELDADTFPAEAGLEARAVSFEKGCYVGQETVARMHYKGHPNRRLRILRAEQELSSGAPVNAADGSDVGRVGTVSPADGGRSALAVLRREVEPGDAVDAGGVAATVFETPVQNAS